MVPAVVEYGTFPVMGVVVFIKKELGVEKGLCVRCVVERILCSVFDISEYVHGHVGMSVCDVLYTLP